MENNLLRQILVVTSPTLLNGDHATSVAALCRKHQLVILMYFGDERYDIPGTYLMPHNAHLVYYDYDNLTEALNQLESYLRDYGVEVISRHKTNGEHLPFVLGGSILQVPSDVQLSFFGEAEEEPKLDSTLITIQDTTWDL